MTNKTVKDVIIPKGKYLILDKEVAKDEEEVYAFRNFYLNGLFFERIAVFCGYA